MLLSKNNKTAIQIGILGGGQLAKMYTNEAYRMGMNISIIEKSPNSPAGMMTKNEFPGGWVSEEILNDFIANSDVVTLENEFIDPSILEYIEKQRVVYPSSKTISKIQDKFTQKTNFAKADVPLPIFDKVDTIAEATDFGKANGYPFLIKTRTLGYDGYGNRTIHNEGDIEKAFADFKEQDSSRELMAEGFVSFSKELAVMVVRSSKGEVKTYPCVETIQKNHICHEVLAPAAIDENIRKEAQDIAIKCMEAIDGIGIFGVEMFLTTENEILVNEIAPRPHNSGHYTIEGCYTSQFENGLRAILGLPLGSTEMVKPAAVMINLLGERTGVGTPTSVKGFLSHDKAKLHLYSKESSRPGRKMGHITLVGDDIEEVRKDARLALDAFKW